jgi:hypothetical protein
VVFYTLTLGLVGLALIVGGMVLVITGFQMLPAAEGAAHTIMSVVVAVMGVVAFVGGIVVFFLLAGDGPKAGAKGGYATYVGGAWWGGGGGDGGGGV